MKPIIICILISILTTAYGEQIMWPSLSEISFSKGKPATEDDVNSGAAVFVLKVDETVVGVPIDIEIPQYAFHIDQETGNKTPVIIIQAEESQGKKYIGAISTSKDDYMIGFIYEFELLGNTAPIK